STPMPTTTRRRPPRPATCTACRLPFCAAKAASTGCSAIIPAPRSVPTRSIDPLEKQLVFERRVAIADMRVIDEFGVGVLIRKIIERVRARNGVLHVSFDVDFLDPTVAPGVGTTVPGGATYREAHLIMELLHDSDLVRSVDIVELNPFLDERGRTA